MLKINSNLKLESVSRIELKEDWHKIILSLLNLKEFPYEFQINEVIIDEFFKGEIFIFESVSFKKKIYIALSYDVVKYLYSSEVSDTNIGFSFEEYFPEEKTDILITNVKNIYKSQPATFDIFFEEVILQKYGKTLYLDFRIQFFLNGNFTTLSCYTKKNIVTWKYLFSEDISHMTDYEKMIQDTFIHRKCMQIACQKLCDYLNSVGAYIHANKLMKRAITHDLSKVTCDEELIALSMIINDKSTLKDAKMQLSEMKKDAIKLHYKHNSHHPEHYKTPMDMERIDIMEMTCDWYARSLQMGTDFLEYVKESQKTRFKFPDWMFAEIWHYCEVLAK